MEAKNLCNYKLQDMQENNEIDRLLMSNCTYKNIDSAMGCICKQCFSV